MSRDDAWLMDMLLAARRAVEGLSMAGDELETDWKFQAIVSHELQVLGEAARRVSTDFQGEHCDIPWGMIIGLRNVVTHHYDRIDWQTIRETIERDLPGLIHQLDARVSRME